MTTKRLQPTFLFDVKSIPCGVLVDTYINKRPYRWGAHLCESDLDFYGYTEIEYRLLDRRGYPAPWLEKKVDTEEHDRIYQAIVDHYARELY